MADPSCDELQQRYPGKFANGQLRTLQRHIAVWRAKTVLAFYAGSDDVEHIALASLPRPFTSRHRCRQVRGVHRVSPTERFDNAARDGSRDASTTTLQNGSGC